MMKVTKYEIERAKFQVEKLPSILWIESDDPDRFKAITNQLIDTNQKRKIIYESLFYINGILNGFEREFSGCTNKKGYELVREEYTRRLVRKKW